MARKMRGNQQSNRLTVCRSCGGKLLSDKDAVTSSNGFIYRSRPCSSCGCVIHTKQPPEEFCSMDLD